VGGWGENERAAEARDAGVRSGGGLEFLGSLR
jgi:hypothetical protein